MKQQKIDKIEQNISSELTQQIDKFLLGKIGLRVMSTSEWQLPCFSLSVVFSIAKSRRFNIVEEFIFKCIASGVPELITLKGIQSILQIDNIFIQNRIDEFLRNKLLVKQGDQFAFTDFGRDSYSKGKVPSSPKQEEVDFYYEPMFQKVRNEGNLPSLEAVPLFRYHDETADQDVIEDLELTELDIVEIGNRLGGVYRTESIESVITDIQLPDIVSRTHVRFGEFWTYDIVEDSVSVFVWDYSERRFREDIQSFLHGREAERHLQEVHREMAERDAYYNQIRDALKKQKEAIPTKKKASRQEEVSILRGMSIRNAFLESFKQSKKKLMIISPWISETVVDGPMLQRFKEAADRNVAIYIGWGIAKRQELEDRAPSRQLLDKMRNIRDKQGNPVVFVHWIGNHHSKEIIVDDSYHMLGSFNWLSYRGEYSIRNESVYKIRNKAMVSEAVTHTEDLFLKLLEQRKDSLQTDAEYLAWMNECIRLDTQTQGRLALVEQVLAHLKIHKRTRVLHALCQMFLQMKQYQNGMKELLVFLFEFDGQSDKMKETLKQLQYHRKDMYDQFKSEYEEQFQVLTIQSPAKAAKKVQGKQKAPKTKPNVPKITSPKKQKQKASAAK